MIRDLFFFICFFLAFSASAEKKFVAPNGDPSNSGTLESPWSLAHGLSISSGISAGDSLILLDGTYEGNYVSEISGSQGNPIIVLAQNPGKAIFDVGKNRTAETALTINGSYTWFVGLHVTSSSTIKKSDESNGNATIPYESGIAVFGDFNKLINCWVYDVVGGGLELWRTGLNLEVYGCVIFNNGYQGQFRGTGHGMYIQHDDVDRPKIIQNNFVFQNASQGINIFTTNPPNAGVNVTGNVSFNTGVTVDFVPALFRPPHNFSIGSQNNISLEMRVSDNIFYSDLQGGRLQPNGVSNVTLGRTFFPNSDFRFTGNVLYGGRNQIELLPLTRLRLTGNTLYNTHGAFVNFLDDDDKSFPSATWDQNKYVNIIGEDSAFDDLTFQGWKDEYGFDSGSTLLNSPDKSTEVLVTKNAYDPSLYYVTILNLEGLDEVAIDFSGEGIIEGQRYLIRDVQNPFDEDQAVSGEYGGGSITFPMTWNESLQPKGNIPHQVVHSDKTFGTFILELEELDDLEFPTIRDSVAIYLNNVSSSGDFPPSFSATATLEPEDFLVNPPAEAFEFESSRGFIFNCLDLGKNEVKITTTNRQNNESMESILDLYVLDTIAPQLDITAADIDFDPLRGSVELIIFDFDPIIDYDNCTTSYDFELSKEEITCTDIGWRDVEKFIEITAVAVDQSGNKSEPDTGTLLVRWVPSDTVSLSSAGILFEQSTTMLELGDEFDYEVMAWYKDGELLEGLKGKVIEIEEGGRYFAELEPLSGCPVISEVIEINQEPLPFPSFKEEVIISLNEDGIAGLTPEDLFESWPPEEGEFTVETSQSLFTCEDLGDREIGILVKDEMENAWEFSLPIFVRDQISPELEVQNLEITLDRVLGGITLVADDFVTSVSDNCGIEEVILSRNSINCEDIGKEVEIVILAKDQSGNETEKVAVVTVKGEVSAPLTISGDAEFCEGEEGILTLDSDAEFEVLEWRLDGEEIPDENDKTLSVSEQGVYSALIRYEGGCLWESMDFEVSVLEAPTGEIEENGEELIAPSGDFTYQWFKGDEILDGETGQILLVDESGEYSVQLTNENGCASKLPAVEVTISGLFGRPVVKAEQLVIYPNPADSKARVKIDSDPTFKMNSMEIYSVEGKSVTQSITVNALSNTEFDLSLDLVPQGVYFIRIIGDSQKLYIGKIIKR
ncbi:T9SS type A sorting domain-containing protein [Algoriphagus sediminis]|uniref:T9SS type A sorting domain-containing protein n=1 Tax=Algoriphagus sediminis TaxID=3057113 RepID=A0ABT7YAS5_9BACT|nr:T9SS type A sorting domain-containing protein [Algoriphagus sediminis]MDN3203622.1 T9SS type A sorting domain-containing protein [Algoriphagus sediminis]